MEIEIGVGVGMSVAVDGLYPLSSGTEQNKMPEDFALLLELGHPSAPALGHCVPDFWAFELGLELYHWPSWASSLQKADWNFSELHNHMSQLFIIHLFFKMVFKIRPLMPIRVSIYILIVLILRRILTNIIIHTDFHLPLSMKPIGLLVTYWKIQD